MSMGDGKWTGESYSKPQTEAYYNNYGKIFSKGTTERQADLEYLTVQCLKTFTDHDYEFLEGNKYDVVFTAIGRKYVRHHTGFLASFDTGRFKIL